MSLKTIKTFKDLNLKNLGNLFVVELIPNDGKIFEQMGQAVITFNEQEFNVHIFTGIFKKKYIEKTLTYKFNDIKDVDFGTYGFKHPFVRIIIEKDQYLTFSYYFKIKNYEDQEKNIKEFFDVLGEVEIKIED